MAVSLSLFVLLAACNGDDSDSNDAEASLPEPTPTEAIAAEPSPTVDPSPTSEPEPTPTAEATPAMEPTPDFTSEFDDFDLEQILDETVYFSRLEEPINRFADSFLTFEEMLHAADEAWDDPAFRQQLAYHMAEWSLLYTAFGAVEPPEIFEQEHWMIVQGFGYLNRAQEQLWQAFWQDGADSFDFDKFEEESEQGLNDLLEGLDLIREGFDRIGAIMDDRE
jgi:hypothetical protein